MDITVQPTLFNFTYNYATCFKYCKKGSDIIPYFDKDMNQWYWKTKNYQKVE